MTNFTAPNPAPPGPSPSGSVPPAARWRLARSADDVIGGVAGGIAAATGIDVTLVRLAFVAAGFSGFGLIAYLVLWLVIPRQDKQAGEVLYEAPDDTRRWLRLAVLVGGIAGLVGILTDGPPLFDRDGFVVGLLFVIVGAAILYWRRRDDSEPLPWASEASRAPAPPTAPTAPGAPVAPPAQDTWSATSTETGLGGSESWAPPTGEGFDAPASTPFTTSSYQPTPPAPAAGTASRERTPGSAIAARVFGWLAVMIAVPVAIAVGAAENIDALSLRFAGLMLVLAVAAILNLVLQSSMARRAGPVIASIAAVIAVGAVAAALSTWDGHVGENVLGPQSVEDVLPVYKMAAGRQVIDLSDVEIDGSLTVAFDHGVGLTEVVVPDGVDVDIQADVQAGEIELFGTSTDGWNASVGLRETVTEAGQETELPLLELNLDMGFGKIEVCHLSDAHPIGNSFECTD